MKLSTLATILHGELIGKDVEFKNVSIDSRTVKSGDCFFAIRGDVFDGHDFIEDVAAKHVAVAIVDRDVKTAIPCIRVANTREALKQLALYYRKNTSVPVAAITGSCGKTTTRALLENILKQKGNVLASKKSFNNDIGLPLTLLQLQAAHDFVVLEIGTNHPGEIAALTAIAKPTVATVTMVGPVHIEHFGTVDAIAREKGAIFEGLSDQGVAVINVDDAHETLWQSQSSGHRVITFSREKKADVMALDVRSTDMGTTTFTLQIKNQHITIALPLLGEHNVVNALAAAAMAFAMGASLEEIKSGMASAQSEYGRLIEKKGLLGATIIDDSYNANPASVKAAISLLSHRSTQSILVLGDMLELGDHAGLLHQQIGEFAKSAGIKKLFCYGKYSEKTAKAFGKNAWHFNEHAALIDALKNEITSETTVLVKGSRSMKMEKIVEALL